MYWQADIQQRLAEESADEPRAFVDAEVTVHGQHGPKSWDVVINHGSNQVKGLLRTSGGLSLRPRQKLRILDVSQTVNASNPRKGALPDNWRAKRGVLHALINALKSGDSPKTQPNEDQA